jgi:hypothetical protein
MDVEMMHVRAAMAKRSEDASSARLAESIGGAVKREVEMGLPLDQGREVSRGFGSGRPRLPWGSWKWVQALRRGSEQRSTG